MLFRGRLGQHRISRVPFDCTKTICRAGLGASLSGRRRSGHVGEWNEKHSLNAVYA